MDTSIKFDLLMNCANEFLIVFPALPGKATKPTFVYDVSAQKAVLMKDGKKPAAVFTPLPEEAAEPLSDAAHILCVETKDNAVFTEYNATVLVK